MITLTDAHSATFPRTISVKQDGTFIPVVKVLRYDAGTTEEIYPPGATTLRIETNYDGSSAVQAVDGEQYPVPLINPLSESYVDLEVTVTPYPENAGWSLSSSLSFDLGIHTGVVYYGTQTLSFPVAAPSEPGMVEHHISAVPLSGGNGAVTAKFVAIKYSESTTVYNHDYRLNQSLIDRQEGPSLVNVNAAANGGYVATYTDGQAEGEKALRGWYDGALPLTPNRFQAQLDLSDWKSTGLSVGIVGRFNKGGRFGFVDPDYESDVYAGHHLFIELSWREPRFYGPSGFADSKPQLTSADRVEYANWSHFAITLTPAIDVLNHPDVTVTQSAETGPGPYHSTTIVYTSPAVAYTATVNLTSYEPIADFDFFIMRGYRNGVLMGEGFVKNNASSIDPPGDGILTVLFKDGSEQQTTYDILDKIYVYKGVLSAGDIASECAVIGITVGAGAVVPPQNPNSPRLRNAPADLSAVPITPRLKGFVIDDQTIAVACVFREWFLDRLDAEFPYAVAAEHNYRYGYTPEWQYVFYNKFNIWDLYRDYQPIIVDHLDDQANYTVDGGAATLLGRWATSIGLLKHPDLLDGTRAVETGCPDIVQYAYLRLPAPMLAGSVHTVSVMGQSVQITYDRAQHSGAIKVNQEGYLPEAGRKYAYLGSWLGVSTAGTAGPYDPTANPRFTAMFEVRPVGSETPVFVGALVLRDTPEQIDTHDGNFLQITGERVYQADFSALQAEGTYQVFVPGVGYSHEFVIGRAAIAKAFWLTARGLFHHRSGADGIGPPHTNWPWGNAHGMTWEADFPTDEGSYSRIQTADGSTYPALIGNAFTLKDTLATGRLFREVKGGWFDAADFDRRPMHVIPARDLIEPYLRNPAHFTDNQLNLPESGNTIPDILSEAEYGLDVWRRCQSPEGGIALWIETDVHEKDWPWLSEKKYYLGTRNRFDSLQYAWTAAKLARALRIAGGDYALEKSAIYAESAARAFWWGMDEANTCNLQFTIEKSGIIHSFSYTEDPALFGRTVAPAAAAMFALTKDPRYAACLTQEAFDAHFTNYVKTDENNFTRYASTELMLDLVDEFPDFCGAYRDNFVERAQAWKARQERHPYYAINWHPDSEWYLYNYVDWGMGHPDTRGRAFVYAWWITGDDAWRDTALVAMDYAGGCNPTGRTMVTGLGHVPPVHHLDGWLTRAEVELGIYDPTPGISPYQITNMFGYASGYTGVVGHVYRPTLEPRSGEFFTGVNLNLLPGGYSKTVANAQTSVSSFIKTQFPFWRQACELEDNYVKGAEYTIWETCSGKAFMWGALLGGPFVPDPAWAATEPAATRYDAKGVIFLP